MIRITKSFLFAFAALLLLTSLSASAQQIDKKADELFKSHCFEKATERYLKVFHSNPSNKANPAMLKRITESILSSEMLRDTARYFADLYLQFEPEDAEAYFMSAEAHYHAHDFDIALQRLDSFMVRATSEQDIIDADLLNSWIRNARRMLKDTLRNPIINLGDVINTRNNEINPYIINDGHSLVFSCDDKFDRDAVITVFNVKSSDQTALSWSPAKKVSTINSLADEYPTGPTPDGFFFCTNNSGSNFTLNTTRYSTGGRCSEAEKMPSPINMPGSEVAGCLSPTGDTLYFSATNDYGDLDIFYSIRSYNGNWMKPRPIPGLVNREDFDENYPAFLWSSIGTHVIPHHRHHMTILSRYSVGHPLYAASVLAPAHPTLGLRTCPLPCFFAVSESHAPLPGRDASPQLSFIPKTAWYRSLAPQASFASLTSADPQRP